MAIKSFNLQNLGPLASIQGFGFGATYVDIVLVFQSPLQRGHNYDKFNDSIMLYFAMQLNLSKTPQSLLPNKFNLFYAISSGYSIITIAQVADASVYKQTSVAFFFTY